MTPDSKTETPQRVGPLAPGSVIYALFEHMADEHGLTLLESELTEIVRLVNDTLDERLRWWIANAEGIAQERGELFRAGEAMRAVMVGHAWDGEEVGAWDALAKPMRDMIAALSQNNRNLTAAEPARCENCGKQAVRLTEDGINLCRECYALCPEDTPNT
jgi:hypothetical protein